MQRSHEKVNLLVIFASALVLRAARGFGGYPNGDDFTYVPIALSEYDPKLFARDIFVSQFTLRKAGLSTLLHWMQETTGFPWGFAVATIILSLATVWVLWLFLRESRISIYWLPLFTAICLNPRPGLCGIGRGVFGGLLANSFTGQWAALLFLLSSYYCFCSNKQIRAGLCLGLAAGLNAAIGVHGAFVILVAVLWRGRNRIWTLVTIGVVGALTALPLILSVVGNTMEGGDFQHPAAQPIIAEDTYLFRLPHEFTLYAQTTEQLFLVFLAILFGFVGYTRIAKFEERPVVRNIFGVFLGQSLLILAFLICHVWETSKWWNETQGWHFLLSLSRTTPITLFLGVLLACIAVVYELPALIVAFSRRTKADLAAMLYILAVMLFVAEFSIRGSLGSGLLIVLAVLLYSGWRFVPMRRMMPGMLIFVIGVSSFSIVRASDKVVTFSSEQENLFSWVRTATSQDALFIIPPGFIEFRINTMRSAYVDFKNFPITVPRLVPEWRRRLEEISRPTDSVKKTARGFDGIVEWDESYALTNTENEIHRLLSVTGADYLVFDKDALLQAPIVRPPELSDSALSTVYENRRYRVFARSDS